MKHPVATGPVQALLDEVLLLDPEARPAWLDALALQGQPEAAAQLRVWLAARDAASRAGFMADTAAPAWQTRLLGEGSQLGAWTLQTCVGEGGMGQVWQARRHDGRFEGHAAIKLIKPGLLGPQQAARFQREGQLLARLDHPHIARLLDAGLAGDGQPYLVLEWVQGEPIDRWCDQRHLSLQARLTLFLTLLDAVAAAHRQLVVHRDLKPANVLVNQSGEVKLLDFGIAKLLDGDSRPDAAPDTALTQAPGGLLSPGHAAPEQWQGGPISTATDVYALGVLLYQLLAGRHPLLEPGASLAQSLQATLERDAPLASTRVGDTLLLRQLRGDLDQILACALARDPAARYAGAADFAADLRRYLAHQPVLAQAPRLAYRLAKFGRRHRQALLASLIPVALLIGLAGHAWRQQQAALTSRTQAQAVQGLLESLFNGMRPEVATERRFTAAELLARARSFLAGQSGLDAATERALQLRMAGLSSDIGDYAQAAAGYRAEALAASQRGQPAEQALALAQLANAELRQLDFDTAAHSLDQLQALLGNAGLAHNAELQGRHALLRGEWLLRRGQLPRADSLLAQAEQWLAQVQPAPLELLGHAAQTRGTLAHDRRHFADARVHLARADALQAQRGVDGQVDRLNLARDLARVESWTGHYARADALAEPALLDLQARWGEAHPLVRDLVTVLTHTALRQGQFERVDRYLVRLRAEPRQPDLLAYADEISARMRMYRGDAAGAEPQLRQTLDAALALDGGQPSSYSETQRRFLAEALLRQGRPDAALPLLLQAQSELARLFQPRHNTVASVQVLLGVALAQQGDPAGARLQWLAARPVLAAELGEAHPFCRVTDAYLALGASPFDATAAARLAQHLRTELGWQHGANTLAQALLAGPPAPGRQARAWWQLPVVF